MSISKKRIFSIGIVLLWMLMMFSLSTSIGSSENTHYLLEASLRKLSRILPLATAPQMIGTANWMMRKGAHFCEYGILMALLYWLNTRSFALQPKKGLIVGFVSVVLFAITDEFHQSFVPERTSLFSDVLIDLSGASVSCLLLWWNDIRRSPRTTHVWACQYLGLWYRFVWITV